MDSDSEADLAELEERLYSQVHHEASWEHPDDYKGPAQPADETPDAAAFPAVSVYAARTLSNRYWAKPSGAAPNDRYRLNNNNTAASAGHQNAKNRENARRATSTSSPTAATAVPQNAAKTSVHHSPPANQSGHLSKLPPTPPPPVINAKGDNRQRGKENNKVVQNPFATHKKPKPATIGNNNNNNAKSSASGNEWATRPGGTCAYMFREDEYELRPRRPKKKEATGPFARSQVKLEKAKRIREKRDKSKAARAKSMRVIDTIVLQTSSESGGDDDDDVIEIAVPPPPILTISDSDDEEGEESEPDASAAAATPKADSASPQVEQVVHHEENAMTAEDSAFAKPSSARLDDSATAAAEKATAVTDSVPSSRCISPVSVMSSDDFIGQLDRCRLAAAVAAQQADDQELQALAADIDSMLGEGGAAPDVVCVADGEDQDDEDQDDEEEATAQSPPPNGEGPGKPPSEPADDEVVCTHFVVPSSRKSYRVDEGFGRALDVYESESDLTESVYSKGAAKPTVIRSIVASSDDDDDDADGENIGQVPYTTEGKTKRLRKRRASSNRGSDLNTGGDSSSDGEGEQAGGDGVHPTTFPFIAHGMALEKHKTKVAKVAERRTTGSDDEFIASLNNLVQNAYDKHRDTSDEDSDEAEDEEAGGRVAVTARDIAATVLEQSAAAKAKPKTIPEVGRKTKEPAARQKASSSKAAASASASVTTVAVLSSEEEKSQPPFVLSEELRQAIVESDALLRENCEALAEGTWPPGQRRAAEEPPPESYWPLVKQPGQVGGLGWIEEMRRFYECSWHGENFSLSDELRRMSREKSLWRIQPEDRLTRPRNSRVKCRNCLVFGHTRAKCRQPRKAIVCYMCGCSGHTEARCPYTVCLRCGNKTNVFTSSCNLCSSRSYMTCGVCKLKGHVANQCPDHWRRYHSTTTQSGEPNSEVQYKNRKFCSNCGKRGHLYDSCRNAVRFSRYPVITAHIQSHSGVYRPQEEENPYRGIPVNLLYDPDDGDYGFRMTAEVKSRSCYGRFLRAVGLQRPPSPEKRRRRHSQGESVAAATTTEGGAAGKAEAAPSRKKAKRTKADPAGEVASVSDSEDVVEVPQYIPTIDLDRSGDDDSATRDTFKTPAVGPRGPTHDPPLPIDSDSNYSFSEHFDVPAAAAATMPDPDPFDDQPSTSKAAAAAFARASAASTPTPAKTPRSSASNDTPDFIPLSSGRDKRDRTPPASKPGGISQRYVAHVSDDEDGEEDGGDKAPPDTDDKEEACDAKVILSTENSAYLLSPNGRTFLNDVADSCAIRARLDWTSVGYVLFIHGLPQDQDRFHQQLLQKYDQLAEARHREHGANVPKRIDALVRFLRESIGQLLSNVGCVQELMRRVPRLERMRSKNSLKQADRARRALNMILVGQAGLLDGSTHLDKLLEILRKLLDDYSDGDAVPEELRTEILAHWRLIFTAYRHDNYTEMAHRYKALRAANQLPRLSIDPKLLGRHVVDVSLSSEQKERLDRAIGGAPATANPKAPATRGGAKEPPTPIPPQDESAAVAEDISLHVVTPQKEKSGKHKTQSTQATPASTATTISAVTTTSTTTTSTGGRRRSAASLVATATAHSTSTLDVHCDSILGECELTAPTHGGLRARMQDSQAPSMFWSRECLKYIEHSKGFLHNQPRIREKLKHVEQRAQEGLLSYDNYRTIIKLHSCLKGRPRGDAGGGQRAGNT